MLPRIPPGKLNLLREGMLSFWYAGRVKVFAAAEASLS